MSAPDLDVLAQAHHIAQGCFREAQHGAAKCARELAAWERLIEAQRRAAKAAHDAYRDAAYEARPRVGCEARP